MPHRILIVDDDPNVMQMLHDILTDEGYEVATAAQSLRAFERAKEARPHLILQNYFMPYLDGLEQTRLRLLDDDLKHIPCISISANSRALDGVDRKELGIVDFLVTPFEIAALLDSIDRALADTRTSGV